MAPQTGEGRRCRQSKIDFISSALAVLQFSNRLRRPTPFAGDWVPEIMVDNRRVLT